MSLESGSKVNGRVVAELPITDEVIQRVEELGIQQRQPFRASKMLQYEWKPGLIVDDDDDDIDTSTSSLSTSIIPPKSLRVT